MKPNEDILEFAVSQAVDGVLPDADRRRLGARLTTGESRQWAADHERIIALLRESDPLPPVDFASFATDFSFALEAEKSYAPAPLPMWPVWRRRLAMAAAVALTFAASWPFLPHADDRPAGPIGSVSVAVPVMATPTTAPVAVIAVGPSDTMKERGLAMGLGTEATSSTKPKVVISSASTPGDVRPY